jgi:hypothetical protein
LGFRGELGLAVRTEAEREVVGRTVTLRSGLALVVAVVKVWVEV